MTHYILQYHYGVVDHYADGNRKRRKRNDVDGAIGYEQVDESTDKRYRYRQGEKAHSRYFSEDAYRDMTSYTKYRDNKELLIIPGANHTDLYDGGDKNAIPFDKLQSFFEANLK